MKKSILSKNRAMIYFVVFVLLFESFGFGMKIETKAAANSIVLGAPKLVDNSNTSYYFDNLTVTFEPGVRAKNITIMVEDAVADTNNSSGYFDVSQALRYLSELEVAHDSVSVTLDKNQNRYLMYEFYLKSDLSEVYIQNLLRKICFTARAGVDQIVTIQIDNYSQGVGIYNDGLPYNIDLQKKKMSDGRSHYYSFIPATNINWANAYNRAKGLRVMGMQGYLATITCAEEEAILRFNLQAGWIGGVRKKSICEDYDILNQEKGIDPNNYFWFDYDSNATIASGTEMETFYWAAGPEHGYQIGSEKSPFRYWNTDEPNNQHKAGVNGIECREGCINIHSGDGGWNDLPNKLTYYKDQNGHYFISGYFVEFGGYPIKNGRETDPGLLNEDSSKKIASVTNRIDPTIPNNQIKVKGIIKGTNKVNARKVRFEHVLGTQYEADVDPTTYSYEICPISEGEYSIEVFDASGKELYPQPDSAYIYNQPGRPRVIDLKVENNNGISGLISGSAAADVKKINLKNISTNDVFSSDSVMNNEFIISEIPNGNYTLTTNLSGVSYSTKRFIVDTEKKDGYDFEVNYTKTTLTGSVLGYSEKQAKEVVLVGNQEPISATITETGKYTISNVLPGDYQVQVKNANGELIAAKPSHITIEEYPYKKTTQNLDLNTPKEANISGRLSGNHAENVSMIMLVDSSGKRVYADMKGLEFLIQGIPLGKYTVSLSGTTVRPVPSTITVTESGDFTENIIVDDSKKRIEIVRELNIDKVNSEANRANTEIDLIKGLSEAQKKTAKDIVQNALAEAKKEIEQVLNETNAKAISDSFSQKMNLLIEEQKKIASSQKDEPKEDIKQEKEEKEPGSDQKDDVSTEKIPENALLSSVEKQILTANTDKREIAGSRYSKMQLKGTGKKKSVKLTWKKQADADGYVIYGAKCGNYYQKLKMIDSNQITSWTHKNCKQGSYYKYIVLAVKKSTSDDRVLERSNGVHVVTLGGGKGNPTKLIIKKSKVTIKKGKTHQISAKYKSDKKVQKHIAYIRYESDNKKVATVSKKGKVKAVRKGKCNIYVYAQNGVGKRINVTVK